ncbi:(Fe-S)-binding protein [Shouchella clausii]|uniref:(Fe-S)-binding protein n=1 Tax=Shouchella clausii TaxID=79880 RepID=UPI000D1FC596|nr:(Fe-S)-binding protein [Shouchella clausii]PTL22187.1 glycolate oxidase [Shouchella clausii]
MTKLEQLLAYQETFDCVQCGYCLPSCPTYLSMEKETHSPRGRIHLVKMAAEGKLPLSEIEEPIDLCLGCRACETVCPTNVQYGKILDSAKVALKEERKTTAPWHQKMMKKAMFETVLPNDRVLHAIGTGLSLYQKSGVARIARKAKLTRMLPKSLAAFEAVTPAVASRRERKNRLVDVKPEGDTALRVGFFKGCLMDTMFSHINDLTIQLLQRVGCEVTVIEEQTCCGALQNHSGERDVAKRLAKQNIEAFEQYDCDYMVNSIGGCGAMLVEYDELLADEPEWRERASRFAEKTVDSSVIFSQLQLPFVKQLNGVATYQPSCHMVNVQKRIEEPVKLLQSIPGITFVPMKESELCCGSAGIYNLVHYEQSMKILDRKMENVKAVQPEIIVTTNPGCHLHMKLGVEREGRSEQIKVVHLIELLAEACDVGGGKRNV